MLQKNMYLLLTAAWMITFSFIIDNYWSANSSSAAVQRKMSSYIREQENDFDTLAANIGLVNRIVSKEYDEKLLKQLTAKKLFSVCL
ncbi:MAG: hypothetical protein IPP72_01615 [Chitinophagaceae bacterium]|nr:hypothetical protein [Chitinophagaceae bacterium]